MRKVFRNKSNTLYWDQRWRSVGVDKNAFQNLDMYPIKYAEMAAEGSQRMLDIGCGAGRLYFHYQAAGKDMEGIESSPVAVENIKQHDPRAKVLSGSVTEMPYDDGTFDAAFAFGVYHNIEGEEALGKAFAETARVLKPNGRLAASVRCDNLENRLLERIKKNRMPAGTECTEFHKWQFSLRVLHGLLSCHGLEVYRAYYARNISFLFQFDVFRDRALKSSVFEESDARSKGFQLNRVGKLLDAFLHTCFPRQFSNVLVVLARKNRTP